MPFPKTRVCTFNVYNLVNPGVPYYESKPYSPAEFAEKTAWIGRQLDQMGADIAGFQEVFHGDALRAALAQSERFKDVEPIILATNEEENPAMTPAVALASRYPVLEAQSISAFPPEAIITLEPSNEPGPSTSSGTGSAGSGSGLARSASSPSTGSGSGLARSASSPSTGSGGDGVPEPVEGQLIVPVASFSRPVLKARVLVGETEIVIFVAHLKSKRPTYYKGESAENPLHRTLGSARSLVRRAAEAAALRALILEEVATARSVSSPSTGSGGGSTPSAPSTGSGGEGSGRPVIVLGDVNDATLAVTTQMIAGEKPYYRYGRERKEVYWDTLLYSAQEIQNRSSTRDTYFTYIYNGFYEALDQILVSEELYRLNPDRVGEVYYVQIFNDHIIDATQTFEPAPRTKSDHGQVVAWLRKA